jgi:DNA-binding NarL/FixJ family response regulator
MGLLEMRIPGMEMHVVTFVFSALEIVMFFYQLIFFISRPADKSRLRYLILLMLLIIYNVVGGLLPDNNIDIPVQLQNCFSYSTGFLMAAYFPYYFYKSELLNYLIKKLKETYNIYASRNGNEALKKLKEGAAPDMIISDIMMDVMDGFEFAKILSQSAEYNHIPLLFITAKSTQKDKLEGLSIGAIDVIHKPFSMAELEFKIEAVLSSHNRQRQVLLSFMASQSLSMLAKAGKQIYMEEPAGSLQKFELNCKIYNLTSQEVEVVKLMAEGLTYKNIGEKLHISEHTVKTHAQHMFKKVEVQNKLALIQKLEFSR